jgi:hypothetical protein
VTAADDPLLDAGRLRSLLTELGERLDRRGMAAQLFVVGGAAMALAFNRERVTRDIDAVFEPKQEVYAEAARMAADGALPPDWLNDGVKGLMPERGGDESDVGTQFSSPGIAVQVASAEYLFAMKAQAARVEVDGGDLTHLAAHLGLATLQDALDLVEQYYGPQRLLPKTRYLLEEILGGLGDGHDAS